MNTKTNHKKQLPIVMKVEVVNSRWLINGKQYSECGFVEKYYFDLYLRTHQAEKSA